MAGPIPLRQFRQVCEHEKMTGWAAMHRNQQLLLNSGGASGVASGTSVVVRSSPVTTSASGTPLTVKYRMPCTGAGDLPRLSPAKSPGKAVAALSTMVIIVPSPD